MADPKIDELKRDLSKILDENRKLTARVTTLENTTSGLRNSPMIQGYTGQKLTLNAPLNVLDWLTRINDIAAGVLNSATAHTNSAIGTTNSDLSSLATEVDSLSASITSLSQSLLNLLAALSAGEIPYLAATGRFAGSGIKSSGVAVEVTAPMTTSGGRISKVTHVTTTPYTVDSADESLFVDTDTAAISVLLGAGVPGRRVRIHNCGSSGNDVTVTPNGTEKLDGVSAAKTLSDGGTVDLEYETTEGWR